MAFIRFFFWLALVIVPVSGTAAAQNAPTTLTLWHIATEGDPFRPVLQSAIDTYNAAHPQLQIEARAIENDQFRRELENAMLSGQPPDIFQTWGGEVLYSYVQAGAVRPVAELSSGWQERFLPQALMPSTFDGQHYAVPANLAGVFLWYNRDLFERFSLPPPATWEQLMNACRTFRSAGIVPVALGNAERWPGGFWLAYLMMRLNDQATSASSMSQLQALLNTSIVTEAGARLQEAVQQGCFQSGDESNGIGTAQRWLATGEAAMQLQGDWNLGGLRAVDAAFVDRSIDVLPFPAMSSTAATTPVLGGTGQAFAISADAPPQAGEALLQMLGTPIFGSAVAQAGFIPALAESHSRIADVRVQRMAQAITQAPYVQLYYDQLLPTWPAARMLGIVQELLSNTMTPTQAANAIRLALQPTGTDDAAFAQQAESTGSLRSAARSHDLLIGTAVVVEAVRGEPDYASTLAREFNLLTPEMSLKWDALRPSQTTFDFDDADFLVGFAQENAMQVRGHTLVWHRQLPGWLEYGGFSRDELLEILREHIFTVVSRYRGRIQRWDVVNEAVNEDGTLRDSVWLRTIGPEYIDYAFQWAREADPDALLFYNDYDAEASGPKSDAVYRLAADLVQRGIPIDGVGLQMHVRITRPPSLEGIQQNMARLAALGLQVDITEMDVQIQNSPASNEDRLLQQAQLYGAVMRLCLEQPACQVFTTWGFTDRHTWIPGVTGNADQPLLFDVNIQPKPGYWSLMNMLLGY